MIKQQSFNLTPFYPCKSGVASKSCRQLHTDTKGLSDITLMQISAWLHVISINDCQVTFLCEVRMMPADVVHLKDFHCWKRSKEAHGPSAGEVPAISAACLVQVPYSCPSLLAVTPPETGHVHFSSALPRLRGHFSRITLVSRCSQGKRQDPAHWGWVAQCRNSC